MESMYVKASEVAEISGGEQSKSVQSYCGNE